MGCCRSGGGGGEGGRAVPGARGGVRGRGGGGEGPGAGGGVRRARRAVCVRAHACVPVLSYVSRRCARLRLYVCVWGERVRVWCVYVVVAAVCVSCVRACVCLCVRGGACSRVRHVPSRGWACAETQSLTSRTWLDSDLQLTLPMRLQEVLAVACSGVRPPPLLIIYYNQIMY